MQAALEALLFVSGEPVPAADLARALLAEEHIVEAALRELQERLAEQEGGIQLLRIANGWQLATRPEHEEVIARLGAKAASRLSRPALETLAIIAYRQPITIPEIDAVRGTSASGVIKTLLERRLIVEAGRRPTPGRPALYTTTQDFLHYFAISDLSELPPLETSPTPAPVPAEAVADGRAAVPAED